jgi:hypothetical protein
MHGGQVVHCSSRSILAESIVGEPREKTNVFCELPNTTGANNEEALRIFIKLEL